MAKAKESCAKRGRSTRPRLTVRERAERAGEIAAMRDMKIPWGRIAAEHGISIRQAQNIAADWRAAAHEAGDEPGDPIESLVSILNAVCEEFALMVHRTTHDGYRASALKNLAEIAVMRLTILRQAGLAPRSLAGPTVAAQTAIVFREFAELLRRNRVDDDVLRDFLALAESRMGGVGERHTLTTGAPA
jgi:hypothetical protein